MKHALCAATNFEGTDLALAGCINDATEWAGVLRARGYDVETLLGPGMTRQRLVDGIDARLAATRRGDTFVLTLSSHGTQVADRSADELDRWDEAIVPDDYRTAGVIRDDTLGGLLDAWAERKTGGRVVILADLCFSGTLTRGVMAPRRPETVSRYLPPVDAVPDLVGQIGARSIVTPRRTGTLARTAEQAGVILLSACAENEVAWDAYFDGRPNGAWSRAALDALHTDRPRTYTAWNKAIRARIKHPQTPQLVVPGPPWRKYTRPL